MAIKAAEEEKQDVTEETVDINEELVEYTAPLFGRNQQDVTVGVNGELLRIQRGVPVMVKRKFLRVLEESAKQEMQAYKARQAAKEAGSRPLAEL